MRGRRRTGSRGGSSLADKRQGINGFECRVYEVSGDSVMEMTAAFKGMAGASCCSILFAQSIPRKHINKRNWLNYVRNTYLGGDIRKTASHDSCFPLSILQHKNTNYLHLPAAHEWLVVIPLTMIFLLLKCSNILYKASIYVCRKTNDKKSSQICILAHQISCRIHVPFLCSCHHLIIFAITRLGALQHTLQGL